MAARFCRYNTGPLKSSNLIRIGMRKLSLNFLATTIQSTKHFDSKVLAQYYACKKTALRADSNNIARKKGIRDSVAGE